MFNVFVVFVDAFAAAVVVAEEESDNGDGDDHDDRATFFSPSGNPQL